MKGINPYRNVLFVLFKMKLGSGGSSMKKRLALILALLLMCTALVACSHEEFSAGTRTEKEYVSEWMGLKYTLNDNMKMASDSELIEKKRPELPERLTNVIFCKNPRCITTTEQELPHIFKLTDRENRVYRCLYCETQAKK